MPLVAADAPDVATAAAAAAALGAQLRARCTSSAAAAVPLTESVLLSLKPVQGLREVAAVASEADAAWPAAASPDTQRRDRALYAASAAMLAESRAAAPETQLPDPRKGNAALRWSVVIALGRRGAAPPTSHRSHDGLCLRAWDVLSLIHI